MLSTEQEDSDLKHMCLVHMHTAMLTWSEHTGSLSFLS